MAIPAVAPKGGVCIGTVTAGDSSFHFASEILLEECLCANNEGAVNSYPSSPHAPIWSLLSFQAQYRKYSEQPQFPPWEMTRLLQGVDKAAPPAICPSVQLCQHLCRPPEHHPVSQLPGALHCCMWAGERLLQMGHNFILGQLEWAGDPRGSWRNLFQVGSRLTPFPVLTHCSSYHSREGGKIEELAGCETVLCIRGMPEERNGEIQREHWLSMKRINPRKPWV